MDKLRQILATVLAIDPAAITPETSPQNVPSWESFNGLLLVTELEKGFGVSFTVDDIMAVKNVGDIVAALKKYGVELGHE